MRQRTRILAALLTITLATVSAGSATADPGHSSPRAAHALAQAKALISHHASGHTPEWFTTTHGRDASAVLHELALRYEGLDAADRRTARSILARPSDGAADPVGFGYATDEATPYCSAHICVHYVATTSDAPAATDANYNGVPDEVESTDAVFEHVWATEVGKMGYRAPLGDGTEGGDSRLDVYLVDSGQFGVYGFCTTDDTVTDLAGPNPGYCAVDNDFADFGGKPLPELEVTAAHEFFHAVQFAYDSGEDLWFMESTAAWMEDQVYDGVNDNYQYLNIGPLGHPGIPLDYFNVDSNDTGYYPQYGGWVFWKYLSEHHGSALVRQVWERAASTYSLAALHGALSARGLDFTRVFARFGAANRTPARFYSEGSQYPAAPLEKTFTLSPRQPGTGVFRTPQLSHLTNGYVRFTAASTLTGSRRLRVHVDMPDLVRGSVAILMVHHRSGELDLRPIVLDSHGVGQLTVPFTRSRIAFVELALTNASTRYACGQGDYTLSCFGTPKDDFLRSVLTARAIR